MQAMRCKRRGAPASSVGKTEYPFLSAHMVLIQALVYLHNYLKQPEAALGVLKAAQEHYALQVPT